MVKQTPNAKRVMTRIKKLPEFGSRAMDTIWRKYATMFIKTWRDGIMKKQFSLEPLADGTIKRKLAKGYDRPSHPLYGAGINEKNSYINMWVEKRTKSKYMLRPRNVKHHESKLTLAQLLMVHEYGTIINRGGKLCRIKSRPAYRETLKGMLDKVNVKETREEVRKAFAGLINKADESWMGDFERTWDGIWKRLGVDDANG